VTELIFKDGNNLTVEEVAGFMTKREEIDVNARAYNFVLDWIARNVNKFKPNEFGNYVGEAWGKIDKESVYIIKSIFDKEMNNAGFNPVAFLSWAKREGKLCTDSQRRTRRSRIAGVVANCVCLKAESLEIPAGFVEVDSEQIPF
jgi:hypothetical protein